MTRRAESQIDLHFSSTLKNSLDTGDISVIKVGQRIVTGPIHNGIEAGQANRAWEDLAISISSGSTLDIDFYNLPARNVGAGLGRDALGQTLVFEEVVTLIIQKTGGAGQLEVMPSLPSNPVAWVQPQTVANGGALKTNGIRMFHQNSADALDINSSTSHVVRFGANGGTVTMSLYILGKHDDNESSSSSSLSSSRSSSSISSASSISSSVSSLSTSSASSSSTSTLSSSSSTQAASTSSTQVADYSTSSSASTQSSASSSTIGLSTALPLLWKLADPRSLFQHPRQDLDL